MVGEDYAVEVVYLVLHHAGGEIVEGLFFQLEVLVVIADGDDLGSNYVSIDVRNAEAAFVVFRSLFTLFDDFRIDHLAVEILQLGILLGEVGAVDYDHALADAYLGSGYTAAVGLLHGLIHIHKQFLDCIEVVFLKIHRGRHLPEDGRSVKKNR